MMSTNRGEVGRSGKKSVYCLFFVCFLTLIVCFCHFVSLYVSFLFVFLSLFLFVFCHFLFVFCHFLSLFPPFNPLFSLFFPSLEAVQAKPIDDMELARHVAAVYCEAIRCNQELLEQFSKANKDKMTAILEDISAAYKEKWPGRSTPYQLNISLADAMMFLK